MEVCVVTEREERSKEHYYGEGGVGILSFHMDGSDDDDDDRDDDFIDHNDDDEVYLSLSQLFASLYYCLMISQAYCKSSASYNLPFKWWYMTAPVDGCDIL